MELLQALAVNLSVTWCPPPCPVQPLWQTDVAGGTQLEAAIMAQALKCSLYETVPQLCCCYSSATVLLVFSIMHCVLMLALDPKHQQFHPSPPPTVPMLFDLLSFSSSLYIFLLLIPAPADVCVCVCARVSLFRIIVWISTVLSLCCIQCVWLTLDWLDMTWSKSKQLETQFCEY